MDVGRAPPGMDRDVVAVGVLVGLPEEVGEVREQPEAAAEGQVDVGLGRGRPFLNDINDFLNPHCCKYNIIQNVLIFFCLNPFFGNFYYWAFF